jgi:hypothetical protein
MRCALAIAFAALLTPFAYSATTTLFGGNGGHPNPDGSPLSINNGFLVTVNQSTGTVTTVGHPSGIQKISGLAFGLDGLLWASSLTPSGFPPPLPNSPTSDLLLLNPVNGSLVSDIGQIKYNGNPVQIADLAIQTGTNVLYGVGASSSGDSAVAGNLYTINKQTGVATLVGNTGDFFNAIAFGPNGTLYDTTADLDNMGNLVNNQLKTINPLNGKTLTAVPIVQAPGALAVRFDGVIFEGNGDGGGDPLGGGIFTVDPVTGTETLIGHTGLNFVGDLAFPPGVPEPGPMLLCGAGLLGLGVLRRRLAKR